MREGQISEGVKHSRYYIIEQTVSHYDIFCDNAVNSIQNKKSIIAVVI